MNAELKQERTSQDVELPGACAVCDGPIAARLTANGARGVCLACRLITTLALSRAGDGVQIGHLPVGLA